MALDPAIIKEQSGDAESTHLVYKKSAASL